ncbi:ATP-binding protein [Aquimarina sp. 2201CG5-10]|uniref:ATP-binding protein n=1 Tax=Aquimarina callyspongiae TaxID=3098150 RepID=UPI002AB56EF1|nr:ATP-binding protein [Aquimarina sp. 2201CG5-10]MDY8136360.1 ATP-binding protein [Aquimarina sp. 2201CG5-10]
MAKKKIVITGGPSTGKTTIINRLEQIGETCLHEISRAVTLEAQRQGVEQLFLEDPTLFSQRLLEGRIKQFSEAEVSTETRVFLDRGIPDVIAYMNYANEKSPDHFKKACMTHRYDYVFLLPPWKDIHITDNERYENFEQAKQIYNHLLSTYTDLGYKCIEVPFGTVEDRTQFILDILL